MTRRSDRLRDLTPFAMLRRGCGIRQPLRSRSLSKKPPWEVSEGPLAL